MAKPQKVVSSRAKTVVVSPKRVAVWTTSVVRLGTATFWTATDIRLAACVCKAVYVVAGGAVCVGAKQPNLY